MKVFVAVLALLGSQFSDVSASGCSSCLSKADLSSSAAAHLSFFNAGNDGPCFPYDFGNGVSIISLRFDDSDEQPHVDLLASTSVLHEHYELQRNVL